MLGADIVAKARGDTHVVMMSSAASHGIGPVLYKDVPYDPLADFTHIHLVGHVPERAGGERHARRSRACRELVDHGARQARAR